MYESKPNNWQNNNGNNSGNNQGGYQNNNGGNSGKQWSGNGGGNNNGGGYNSNNGNNNGGGDWKKKSNFFKKAEEDNSEARLYKTYVGTGNREAPQDILARFKALATELEVFGYIQRTGGLDGPDLAFESGVTDPKNLELHLPWRGFNDRESKFTFNTKQAFGIAQMFHPSFDGLKPAIQAFLAKNSRLVLGKDLKGPTMFVVCWSEDGAESSKEKTAKTGNVGHVIAIASAMRIPVFNFGKHDAEQRLRTFLELPNGRAEVSAEQQNQPTEQHQNNGQQSGGYQQQPGQYRGNGGQQYSGQHSNSGQQPGQPSFNDF